MANVKQSAWVLVVIGIGKLFKAALLLIVAVQAHRMLLHPVLAEKMELFLHAVRIDPHNLHVHSLINRVTGVSRRQLEVISFGSFLYAAMFATEGIGLVMRKRWAEYFTVATTALLIPMEIFEIFHGHHRTAKVIVLAINIAIVVYLILRLRRELGYEVAEPKALAASTIPEESVG